MADRVVVKDIGALDKFASDLRRAKQDLERVASQLQSAISAVDGQWQDPQKEKSKQQVEALVKQVRSFSASADGQIGYVSKLAAHLRSTPG